MKYNYDGEAIDEYSDLLGLDEGDFLSLCDDEEDEEEND